MPRRILEELDWDQCFALLRQERIGRIVYMDELGPAAVPVNFALAGSEIVFRTADGAKLTGLRGHPISFEVDQIDDGGRSGWSVLVRGTGDVVEMDDVADLLRRIEGEPPVPWAKSIHNTWVAIKAKTVTGRRLADLAEEDFF